MLDTKQKFLLGLSILFIVVGAAFVHSRLALYEFEQALAPAEQSKARIVGDRLSRLVAKMLYYGVPVEQLRGMREIFDEIQSKHPDLTYIALHQGDKHQGDKLLYLSWTKAASLLFYSVAEPALNTSTQHFINEGENFPSALMPAPKLIKVIEQRVDSIDGESIRLILGIDKQYIAKQQRDILLDSLTVLLVTLLMGMELMVFLYVFTIARPFGTLKQAMERMSQGDFSQVYEFDSQDEIGRSGSLLNRIIVRLNQRFHLSQENTPHLAQSSTKLHPGVTKFGLPKKLNMILEEALIYVRPPLFLVVFAESMSLSFFPDYVSTLYSNMADLPVSKALLTGLPISVFMFIWAISLPKAGLWSEKIGRKRAFLAGGCITAVGLVATSFSQDILQLLLFRSFTAVGYAIVFITAQGYVSDLTSSQNRTRGMAVFLSGFFSGSLCGAATGGILADQIGYQQTFMLSAILAVGSALFASRFFVSHPRAKEKGTLEVTEKAFNLSDIKKLFSNRYFLSITFFSSIPAKAALTGIIYFAGPVYMASIGASKSDVGRVLMLYGLLIILISPTSAWLVDKWRRPREFILLGGVLSCIALFVIAYTGNLVGVALGIAGLGLAHACSVSPQAAMITARVPGETGISSGKIIGLYRLTERIGNISGPILAALLISYVGYQQVFILFGVVILVGSILFYLLAKQSPSPTLPVAVQEAK